MTTEGLGALWQDLAAALVTANDPETLLRTTVQTLHQPFAVSFCIACERTDSAEFNVVCHAGFADGELTVPIRAELGEQLIAVVAEDPFRGRVDALDALGCRGFCGARLTAGGVVLIGSRARDDFTAAELDLLRSVGSLVGTALERLGALHTLTNLDRRKDEFLATLAHELRNPLAAMHNSLQVVRLAHDDLATVHHARSILERQVEQMVRLVDELQDVSRITSNRLELRKEWVELGTILKSAIDTSRPMIEAAGHTLTVKLPPQPVLLDADPVRLVQALSNLLNNSAKYTERGGEVTISALCDGDEVEIRVRDTGIGIPPETMPHIFRIFVQAEGSVSRSQGGLGLGLTLVKRLVELHGGTVRAFSEGAGKGSEFVIRLPVLLLPKHDSAAAPQADVERSITLSDEGAERPVVPYVRRDPPELGTS